jgi:NAD(P)-dependent dehydrogenase (short-subunit alcohol dehydrogenase family)
MSEQQHQAAPMTSFRGRLAVVTGAGSGMGRELVAALAAEGCSVAACDLDRDSVVETNARVRAGAADGVRLSAHLCDVADEASVTGFRDEVVGEHETDHIDLLFNNAGIAGGDSFVAGDRVAWERTFGVCWQGVYNCCRAFVPLLVAGDSGYIVNTSCVNGFWATHGSGAPSTAYSAAKFAVKGFSEALIEDLRVHAPHVKVAVVMPGAVSTGIGVNSTRILGGGRTGGGLEDLRARMIGMGLPAESASDDDLPRFVEALGEVARECECSTSAVDAARIILDGVRSGRWRILVGADAIQIDRAIRADPERAYDPEGPTLTPRWFMPLVLLRGGFDPARAAELTATVELRFGDQRITLRVVAGHLALARHAAVAPDAIVETDPTTLRALITGEETLADAANSGTLTVAGDEAKFEQLIAASRPRED